MTFNMKECSECCIMRPEGQENEDGQWVCTTCWADQDAAEEEERQAWRKDEAARGITTTEPCPRCGDNVWLNCLGCEKLICDGECTCSANLTLRERRFCSEECQALCPDWCTEADSMYDEQTYECDLCHYRVPESDYQGCCRDGECPNKVENLCGDCGHWHEDKQQWFCTACHDATVPEPEPKPVATPAPEGMRPCLLRGKKRFCKLLGDYRMDIYQRNDDGTVGLWVGVYNSASREWEAELEDL